MHAALDHGAIPKKIKAIPINKLSKELKSLSALFIPTENIIRGMLNKSTITLPIEKLVLFNKFIEAEIEPKQDKINDPIIKVEIKLYNSLAGRLKKILTIGRETKKGIWTKIK
jgi:hypothetical protein